MIVLEECYQGTNKVRFIEAGSDHVAPLCSGKYLDTCYLVKEDQAVTLYVGMGKLEELYHIQIKELLAKAVKEMGKYKVPEYGIEISGILSQRGASALTDVIEGLVLGMYEFPFYGEREPNSEVQVTLFGFVVTEEHRRRAERSRQVAESIIFTRNIVNAPGNHLRPMDFAREITRYMEGTSVETEQLVYGQLKAMGMNGLAGIGGSSEFPPCFYIMRYMGDPSTDQITGMVGKGVTCDTGGYCLKPSSSMLGIKGDMAGGAAVAGVIHALAVNQAKVNVVGLVPMCENRISQGSILPGDVIRSYSGKTIEIVNTDAEGRLILADAVTYAIRHEKISRVVDVATLTGAVVHMLGFSIGGVLSDQEEFFKEFQAAYEYSGEQYWRLPFYKEHLDMIKSNIADVKNMGESHCGTITAGLFVRSFAEEKPWLHLDIAGTAWVDTPVYEFQAKGATGAGVTSLYYLCNQEEIL